MPETYTGNEGNEAQSAGLDVMDGGEKVRGTNGGYRGINKTRDMIVWALNTAKAYADSLFASISLSWGSISGKPATFPPSAHNHTPGAIVNGGNFGGNSSTAYGFPGPVFVDQSVSLTNGHVFVPASTGAVSGYTVAYINGDGRLSRGVSTQRAKDDITPVDPMSLGNIFPPLDSFVMKDDPDQLLHLGHIAEKLAADENLSRFVVFERTPVYDEAGAVIGSEYAHDDDGNRLVLSYDFLELLLAQTAQLDARDKQRELELEQLHTRLAALEAKR